MSEAQVAGAEVISILRSMEGLPYFGEPVSQLAHSLQSGWHMRERGGDDVAVLAAVLHDIGRAGGLSVRGEPHEITGGRWCEEQFGERCGYLVASHVPAKRVLVATDPTYGDLLSKTSVATLRVQGGPADESEVAEFMTSPWADEALDLRRCDEAAKDPDGPALSLEEVGEIVDRLRVEAGNR